MNEDGSDYNQGVVIHAETKEGNVQKKRERLDHKIMN